MKNQQQIILLAISIVIAFSFLSYRRFASLKSGEELGVDVFYHVKMADGGPLFCLQRTFPHTDLSIWKTRFYDKELAFHLVLSIIRHWQHFLGLNPDPPFHFPALAILLLNLIIISWIAFRFDPKYAYLWPLLYVFISPGFANRLLMLRPHHMAIILLVLAGYCFPKVISKKQLWIPASFAVLFVYTYSNPHFILIPAFIWALFLAGKKDYKLGWWVMGMTLLGLVLAMLIHPQSPNTFVLWKVQCIDVPLEIVFGGIDLGIGPELKSPSTAWLLFNIGIFLLGTINLAAFITFCRWFSWSKTGIYTRYFLCLQTLFIPGLFFSIRPIEYAVPFAVLSTALLWRDFQKQEEITLRLRRTVLAVIMAIVVLPILAFPWTFMLQLQPSRYFAEYREWARENLPPGTLVANIGWGDFTRLFYSAPHCRYLVALDPMFAYAANPETTMKMRQFHKGVYIIYPGEMKKITGADFAFIGLADESEKRRADAMIKKLGYRPVYIGRDGCLFDLRNSPQTLK